MTAKEKEGPNSDAARKRYLFIDKSLESAPKEYRKFADATKSYSNALTSFHRIAGFLARFAPGPELESAFYERLRHYETKLDQTLEGLFSRLTDNRSPAERAQIARYLGAIAALHLSRKLPRIHHGQALDSANLTIRRMILFGVRETEKATGEIIDQNYTNDLIGELIDPKPHTVQSLTYKTFKTAMFVEKPLLLVNGRSGT